MPRVFISYRRADSAAFCGRIYDHLCQRFKQRNIFKDVDSIPPGVDFPSFIEQTLARSDVTLVVIGPRWLGASELAGSRLADPMDFVRMEIETALRLGMAVLPVLVDGAAMPPAETLPESLSQLTRLNALVVRNDPDFRRDMQRVVSALQSIPTHKVTSGPRRLSHTPDAFGPPPQTKVTRHNSQPESPAGGMATLAIEPLAPAKSLAAPEFKMRASGTHASASSLGAETSVQRIAVASLAKPRHTVVSRPLLLAAVALIVVAMVATSPFTLPQLTGHTDLFMTTAQKTVTAESRATVRAAYASRTAEAVTMATVAAVANIATKAKPIGLGYSSDKPGCDITYWVPPFYINPNCSSTSGMTLTGKDYSADLVSARVNESHNTYTVRVTVTNLQGGCVIKLQGSKQALYLTLKAQQNTATWALGVDQGGGTPAIEDMTSGPIQVAPAYIIVMQMTTSKVAYPNDLALVINGKLVQPTGEINPLPNGQFYTYDAGLLEGIGFALTSGITQDSSSENWSATFSNFSLKASS